MREDKGKIKMEVCEGTQWREKPRNVMLHLIKVQNVAGTQRSHMVCCHRSNGVHLLLSSTLLIGTINRRTLKLGF